MEYVDENETIVEPEDEDGGWVSTHNTDSTTNQQSTTTQDEKTTEIQLDSDKVNNLLLIISKARIFSCTLGDFNKHSTIPKRLFLPINRLNFQSMEFRGYLNLY
jgi:hypothetical protein